MFMVYANILYYETLSIDKPKTLIVNKEVFTFFEGESLKVDVPL